MKQLKMFLMLLLISLFFIPNTYAYVIDNATFDNAIGYNSSDTAVYNPTNNVNNNWVISKNTKPTFKVRLQAVDTSTVSTGQLILYVNMCYDSRNTLIEQDSISNNKGSLLKLQKIGQSTQSDSCSFGSWNGTLIQTSWIMNYNLVRDNSGYSFLDSTINFILPNTPLGFNTTMRFVNVYIDKYDENIVQSIKNSQIGEATNQKLNDINSNINSTNDKLDSILDTSSPNLDGLSNANTWLPSGPVDSLIMLPLNFINTLINKIGSTCSPINLPIPFLDNKYLSLPCVSTLFSQINGFSTLYNLIGVIGSVYLLYNYFIRFYKWVDDTLTLRENTWQDWGGD